MERHLSLPATACILNAFARAVPMYEVLRPFCLICRPRRLPDV